MRKIVFLLPLFLIFSNYIYAAEKLDGYYWLELTFTEKSIFFAGFIGGYRSGMLEGNMVGNIEGIGNAIKVIEKYGVKIDETMRSEMGENYRQRVIYGDIISTYTFPNPKYMIDEVDAFYQNYPICKEKELPGFLFFFIKQWADKDKKSHSEIASKCKE